jgi:hypothetical protein
MADLCVFIMETVKADDGQYIPCIAQRGVEGFCRSDWKWGTDLATAKRLAEEYNARLGLTPKEAVLLQASTMGGD